MGKFLLLFFCASFFCMYPNHPLIAKGLIASVSFEKKNPPLEKVNKKNVSKRERRFMQQRSKRIKRKIKLNQKRFGIGSGAFGGFFIIIILFFLGLFVIVLFILILVWLIKRNLAWKKITGQNRRENKIKFKEEITKKLPSLSLDDFVEYLCEKMRIGDSKASIYLIRKSKKRGKYRKKRIERLNARIKSSEKRLEELTLEDENWLIPE